MTTFPVKAFPAGLVVSACIVAGSASLVIPNQRQQVEPNVSSFRAQGYTPALPPNIGLASSAGAVEAATGLEAIMTEIKRADRPWSRRLLKLHAADRLGVSDLTLLVGILKLSEIERWPKPGIFPGEDGGLRVEWVVGKRHTTFEIDDEGTAFAYFFDFAAQTEDSEEPVGLDAATKFLRSHLLV